MFFKKKWLPVFLGSFSLFIACASEDKKSDNNQPAGAFYGVLPCASCEGIHTCILLKRDSFIKATYYSSGHARYDRDASGRIYMSKNNEIFMDSGKILSWNKEKRILHLDDADSSEKDRREKVKLTNYIDSNAYGYLYSDTAIFMLNDSGKVIGGPMAEYYILKRMPESFNFEEEIRPLIKNNDSLQNLSILEYDKKHKRTNAPKAPAS